MPPIRRVTRVLRAIALLILVVGPIGVAAFEVHGGGALVGVPPHPLATADERVANYLRDRSPQVDRLLPDGRGGTRFYEHLNGPVGQAFPGAAAIGLSASAPTDIWPESTELHERAHLVDAFLPVEVAALMARLPRAAQGEIAAEDRGQHFAEMAAKAWEVVSPPTGVCLDDTPAERLEDVETRVPGTAGFVARFLRTMPPPEGDHAGALRAIADRLSAPQTHEWIAIWRGLDARRRADGTFEPWGHRTIRENLSARRVALWSSDRWIDRVTAVAILPSLAIVSVAAPLTRDW
jgi:hypothetical protein